MCMCAHCLCCVFCLVLVFILDLCSFFTFGKLSFTQLLVLSSLLLATSVKISHFVIPLFAIKCLSALVHVIGHIKVHTEDIALHHQALRPLN